MLSLWAHMLIEKIYACLINIFMNIFKYESCVYVYVYQLMDMAMLSLWAHMLIEKNICMPYKYISSSWGRKSTCTSKEDFKVRV